MLNYIKSECYRTVKGRGLYLAMGILSGLVLVMNFGLASVSHFDPVFRYGTFRYSLNNYTGVSYCLLVLGAVVPGCLFIDDRRNGVMKNVISYGISREKIFIGKCLTAFFFTFLILLEVMAVYVGSAYLLLDNPEWVPLREMLMGTAAVLPSAVSSLIFMMLLGSLYQKEMTATVWWVVVYYLIPAVSALIGMKFRLIAKIASWMPYVFLSTEAEVYYSSYECLWDTPAGFTKCMISGMAGIVIFTAFGIWRFRKQEF